MADDRLFCTKPFEWFDISDFNGDKGDVYLCCPAWLSVRAGNIRNQTVDEIWNGAEAQKVRRSILDGGFEHCRRDRCPFLETVAGPVSRRSDVTDPELRRVIEEDRTELPYGPRCVSCSYDKSCNLSCPTCRSSVIVEVDRKDEIREIETKLRDEALKEARLLYITGSGDPFGSAAFFRLLTTLDPGSAPQLREIHLHTNGQLWTTRTWEMIPIAVRRLIKHAHISVDAATPETYAMNRRGGSFARLLENLEFVHSLRRDGPLECLMMSMVVQDNNFREMEDFVLLARRFGADAVQFHKLLNWGTFTATEYSQRAVHLPEHPNHAAFLSLFRREIFGSSDVLRGNLSFAREASSQDPVTIAQVIDG